MVKLTTVALAPPEVTDEVLVVKPFETYAAPFKEYEYGGFPPVNSTVNAPLAPPLQRISVVIKLACPKAISSRACNGPEDPVIV